MVVDPNVVTSDKLVASSIDFVEQFSDNVKTLLNAMGHVQMHPMPAGSLIQTYKTEVTPASSRTVGEGEVIPLSMVKRTKDKQYTLGLTDKLRKLITFEAIQRNGFEPAVAMTDAKLRGIAQKNAKKDFFDALNSKGTTKTSGSGLQMAISKGLGTLVKLFEDTDNVGKTIAYANPDDVYGYLGLATLTTQTAFGLKYIQNFLNVDVVFLTAAVPAGKVILTVDNNINFYYVDMRGQAGQTFNMTVDETGLIGVNHSLVNDSLTYQTIVAGGWLILPERTDGLVTSSITVSKQPQDGGNGTEQ